VLSDSSSEDLEVPKKEAKSPAIHGLDAALAGLEEAEDEGFVSELRELERRFTREVTAIGTNDHLAKFLAELRVTQRMFQRKSGSLRDQLARLKSLMQLIEEKMVQSLPVGQIEQRIQETSYALANFRQALEESRIPESRQFGGELEGITQQFQAALANRQRAVDERLAGELASEVRRIQEIFPTRGGGAAGNPIMKLVVDLADVQLKVAAATNPAESSRLIKREIELVEQLRAANHM
jgi:DNA-binding GntR family transcriptional regulator